MASFLRDTAGEPQPLTGEDFPVLALIVSGGHTELVYTDRWLHYRVLGATRDDAAGETLDKFAKYLRLGYPGGPVIQRIGATGDASYHQFPRVMLGRAGYEFSFSGLKTAGINYAKSLPAGELQKHLADIVASFESAVIGELVEKSLKAGSGSGPSHACCRRWCSGKHAAQGEFRPKGECPGVLSIHEVLHRQCCDDCLRGNTPRDGRRQSRLGSGRILIPGNRRQLPGRVTEGRCIDEGPSSVRDGTRVQVMDNTVDLSARVQRGGGK